MTLTKEQEAWLQALESDTYKQGRTYLAYDEPNGETKHCCLGVACVLNPAKAPVKKETTPRGDGALVYEFGDGFQKETCGLSKEMQALLHLRSLGHFKTGFDVTTSDRTFKAESLTQLNDLCGWTFKQIAEYIRANPGNVFTNVT